MVAKTGVVYLQKDKFQLYSPFVGRVFEFRFVPEIVRDLDVVNSELLENLIKVFVTNTKLAPCNLVFVLADNAYFVKDFIQPAPQKTPAQQPAVTKEILEKQAEEFIEHVPFDNVVSKTLPLKNGLKVCATNKDFYETIAIAFEHLNFTVESVIPAMFLGNGVGLKPVLDPPMASMILQKLNTVKQYDLLNQQVFQPQLKQETEEVDEVELERLQLSQNKKPDQKKLYLLAGFIGLILIVLIVVLVQSQLAPPPYHHPASTPAPAANSAAATAPQTNTALATPTLAAAITPVTGLSTQDLSVQIVNASSSATAAQILLARLDTYKFKSVTSQTQQSIGSATTLVSFSPITSQDVRTAVLTEVKKLENNVAVQEKQLGTYDITIVLGE